MTKILFVCHGNICRSPMAEFYMKDLAARAGLAGEFEIDSAATSSEELGNGVYPPLLKAVIWKESRFDASARGSKGEIGLMQVMPSTAETLVGLGYVDGWSYDASNLLDPTTNIEYGVACIDFLDDNLGDTDQVIASPT